MLNDLIKPTILCESCNLPLEVNLREDWEKYRNVKWPFSEGLEFLCWDTVEHQECADEVAAIRYNARKEIEDKERAAYNVTKFREWKQEFSIPIDFHNKTFATIKTHKENKHQIDLCMKYNPHNDFGLLISGPSGCGKTHLAKAMINDEIARIDRLADQSWPYPIFVNASQLLAEIKQKDFTLPRWINFPGWLVIDDIGAENITDWSREIFYRMFETRINKGNRKNFVTTNLSVDELKNRLLERTVSRILETCVPLELKGNDHRIETMQANAKVFYTGSKQSEGN